MKGIVSIFQIQNSVPWSDTRIRKLNLVFFTLRLSVTEELFLFAA